MVILGAGASIEAGLPGSYEMTERLVSQFKERYRYESDADLPSLLHYLCGKLISHESDRGASPFTAIDVERLLGAAQLLSERPTLELAPFVATWDPGVDSFTRRKVDRRQGKKIQDGVLAGNFGDSQIVEGIREIIEAQVGSGDPKVYKRLVDASLLQLRTILDIPDRNKVEYLRPLADLCRRQGSLTVATLNYDLAVETMCEDYGEPCDTGFSSWLSTGSVQLESDCLRLLKLHGSISWWVEDAPPSFNAPGVLPSAKYGISEDPLTDHRRPLVVFGARGKLRADGPFLELFSAAKVAMESADELIVVGYSFRDDHVNELIRGWLARSTERRLTVIAPHFPSRDARDRSDDFRSQLLWNLIDDASYRDRRFVDRLIVHRETALVGLPLVMSQS